MDNEGRPGLLVEVYEYRGASKERGAAGISWAILEFVFGEVEIASGGESRERDEANRSCAITGSVLRAFGTTSDGESKERDEANRS
jgi:hypothetical protein